MTTLSDSPPRRYPSKWPDRALALAGAIAALLSFLLFSWLVWDLVRLGLPQISWTFLTGGVEDAGRSGGIAPLLVSTLWILLCCLTLAIPLGSGCALWLSEFVRRDRFIARVVTVGVDLLASVPSIVFGLFGMVFFAQTLGLGFSILSGGLTLACMILPILVRTTLSALESLPTDLRPAAAALGLSKTTTTIKILFPAALPGIVVGITLGIGRALSETAALLFTSGYSARMPESVSDSGRALSVHIYDLAFNVANGAPMASSSALVLLALILVVNSAAVAISERWLRRRQFNS
jgi:phosphate transport system permease protein